MKKVVNNRTQKFRFSPDNTGDPRYLRELHPKNILRIPKPQITRDHCFGLFMLAMNGAKFANNRGKCPRITNSVQNSPTAATQAANNNPADIEGHL